MHKLMDQELERALGDYGMNVRGLSIEEVIAWNERRPGGHLGL